MRDLTIKELDQVSGAGWNGSSIEMKNLAKC